MGIVIEILSCVFFYIRITRHCLHTRSINAVLPQTCKLEFGVVIVVDDIEAYHFVAFAQQTIGEMKADETGRSRNQYFFLN